jgi:hypothetical protein
MTQLEKRIYEMFTTNTGKAMGDSGSAYGRHWERNIQLSFEDFNKEKEYIVYLEKDPYVVVDTFKLFQNNLEYTPLQDEFDATGLEKDFENYEKWLEEKGYELDIIRNSYNDDVAYTQVYEYAYVLQDGHPSHIIISLHQGCDIRGGYTDCYIFGLSQEYFYPSTIEDIIDNSEYYDFNVIFDNQLLNEEDFKTFVKACLISNKDELYDNFIKMKSAERKLYYTVDYRNAGFGSREISVYQISDNTPHLFFELSCKMNDEGLQFYSDEEEISMWLDDNGYDCEQFEMIQL